jgi:hypothetical protein
MELVRTKRPNISLNKKTTISMNSKELDNLQLQSIFESGETSIPLDEILLLVSQVCPEIDSALIQKIHSDVSAIFSGEYPGFRVSTTKYHNLRHTYSVVLASARLFHGLFHEKHFFSPELITQGLLSAYFHDSGMLLQVTDAAESGANYTKYHEKRSIVILEKYLETNGLPKSFRQNCATIIKYTNLDFESDYLETDDNQLQLCGQVIGSADLLAQMADRYYLESLPLLFQEHQDGGIDNHSSALELMRGTIEFQENVIKKRLKETLGDIAPSMQTHFHVRWDINRNIYQENILQNIEYLEKIIRNCQMDLNCWVKYLRRTPPLTP